MATTAGRFVSKTSTLQILTFFMLETTADDATFRIHATNLERGIILKNKAVVSAAGSICVEAQKFQDFISRFMGDTVAMTLKGDILEMTCGKSVVHLKGLDAADFPPIAVRDPNAKEEILSVDELQDVAARVAFAASSDPKVIDVRPLLGCVFFRGKAAEATDSFIVATAKFDGMDDALVPAASIIEAGKVFKSAKVLKGISTPGRITFVSDSALMSCTLIAGTFPDISAIYPKKISVTAKINKAEVLNAISQIMVVASDERVSKKIQFTFDDVFGTLNLFTHDEISGDVKIDIEAEIKGKAIMVCLNGDYIRQAIERSIPEDVEIKMNGPELPVEISDGPDWRVVMMPMRGGF